MKRFIILLIPVFFLAVSCSNNHDLSDAYGNFESDPLLVAAESQGRIIALSISEGDRLKAGFKAGVMDTMQLHLQRQQLEASRLTIQTKSATIDAQISTETIRLENLERDRSRILSLLEDGAATPKQLDDIEGQIRLVRSGIHGLQSQKKTLLSEEQSLSVQIRLVEDRIDKAHIINPVEGVVLTRYRQEGEVIAPGQPIYKIAGMDTLVLRAYISGSQLSTVHTGQQVTVKFDDGDGIATLPGIVTWIASSAEFTPRIIQTREERVNLVYAMKVAVVNDGRLKIGMPGEVTIQSH